MAGTGLSGNQIENMLRLMDENVALTRAQARAEILIYLRQNEEIVVQQLTDKGEALLPTSVGDFSLTRAYLESTCENPGLGSPKVFRKRFDHWLGNGLFYLFLSASFIFMLLAVIYLAGKIN